MTLVSAGLILIEGDSAERRHNVFIYLLMMHVGAAAVCGMLFPFLALFTRPGFRGDSRGRCRDAGRNSGCDFPAAFVGFGTKAGHDSAAPLASSGSSHRTQAPSQR